MLSAMLELMDIGVFTAATKTLILNEDGGSENVNWIKHALCMTIIKELERLQQLFVVRLPVEHHHAWADTTISVLEGALDTGGFWWCGDPA